MTIKSMLVNHSEEKEKELHPGEVKEIDLNEIFTVGQPGSFIFAMSSDSMKEAGICKGDYVVVRRDLIPDSGQLVVIRSRGRFAIRYFCYPHEYEHKENQDGVVPYGPMGQAEFEVFGVVATVFRKMRRD
ncbi:S24 family peptidase [Anaerobiospirillum sp. NML120449]|uniref:LexA family protein n=1 Tax=Anaerobiospirillum sp. NML120449 TaxID=2932817 RepID=UPI001FF2D7DA|nr:S24 family peptidase [Anaerobiospirillum sp. NML120449]MCK0526595.1 hypothetical protein [Anaerobiospirillum sp. NML120449]